MAEQETEAEVDKDNGDDGDAELSAAEQIRRDNRRARRAAAARRRQRRKRELDEARAVGLDAGEMVDDALARSSDSAARWFVRHFKTIQWLIVGGVGVWVVYTAVDWYQAGRRAEASDALVKGLLAAEGRIESGDEATPSPGDEYDVRPSFSSEQERIEAAAEAFDEAADQREGSGTQALALLNQAGIKLDQGEFDEAKAVYEKVLGMAIAKTTPELKGRAQEGIALTLEGKGDDEGALAAYQALANQGTKGFVELGKLGQARLLNAQGKFKEAKALVDEVLATPADDGDQPSLFAAPSYTRQRAQELSDALLAAHPELKTAALPTAAPIELPTGAADQPVKVQLGDAPAPEQGESSSPSGEGPTEAVDEPSQAPSGHAPTDEAAGDSDPSEGASDDPNPDPGGE